jgi:hypothetical protein
MSTLIYAAFEWRRGHPRVTFRASGNLDASVVVSGDAATKNPDEPEPTIVTW